MILFIAEVILTIFAWRNGWKWLALIPMGVIFLIGMIIGSSVAMSGGSMDNLGGLFMFDLMAIVVLIIMVCKKRKI
jgi:hypothetical protein